MATLTAVAAQAGVSPKGLRVGLVSATSLYSLAASLQAADVVQMVKVPKGATPVYVALSGGTGQGVCKVGDGISTGRYITGYLNSAGSKLTTINTGLVPYTYTADDTIDVLCSLVSTTAGATGAFNLTVIYTMDPGPTGP